MASTKRVLLVDDDTMLRTSLAEQLASAGAYAVAEAANCEEARARAGEGLLNSSSSMSACQTAMAANSAPGYAAAA